MKSRLRAGRVGMSVSSLQRWEVGGEGEERDGRILAPAESVWVCPGAGPEVGTSEEKRRVGGGGMMLPGSDVLGFKVPVGYAGRFLAEGGICFKLALAATNHLCGWFISDSVLIPHPFSLSLLAGGTEMFRVGTPTRCLWTAGAVKV